jgi:hypothetical protein
MSRDQVSLSVRVDRELHQVVRTRAFGERVAVEALLRGWLGAYAEGSLGADGARVARADGVAKTPVEVPVEAMGYPTEADLPRLKMKRPKTGLCEHRVPAGTFCKKCGV